MDAKADLCLLWAVCVLLGFNIVSNNLSVISQQCLVATASSMLTFIELPLCGIKSQQADKGHELLVPGTLYEPRYEKTGLRGFRPVPTQTRLYSHRRWLEA